MDPKREINGMPDIRLLVDKFYERASHDELLAPIFAKRFTGKEHPLEPLYQYWYSVVFEEKSSASPPFPKHADLPLTHKHFDRWLSIFHQTVDDLFTGTTAADAKVKAIRMSEVFRYKMELTNF